MGEAASPATLLVLVCWIATLDIVRYFTLSPFAVILVIGAASPVLLFDFLRLEKIDKIVMPGDFSGRDMARPMCFEYLDNPFQRHDNLTSFVKLSGDTMLPQETYNSRSNDTNFI